MYVICLYLLYIYHKNQLNVGKYTNPMDPMGMCAKRCMFFLSNRNFSTKKWVCSASMELLATHYRGRLVDEWW